jgi:hypothetical protein
VLLTKVVAKKVSVPFADHTTTLLLWVSSTKVDPVTVNTRSELPAIALTGEIEMPGGPVGGPIELAPEPHPPIPINSDRKQSDTAFLAFIQSSLHALAKKIGIRAIPFGEAVAVNPR